jgi:hypothetical protein
MPKKENPNQCEQNDCNEKAEYIVYWPNQETRQCWEHATKIQVFGKHMSIHIPIVPILKEDKLA